MGRRDTRRELADMREGVLFGTMFGLGVAAVAIGVTVSRLVVGPAPDRGAAAPAAALEASAPAVSPAGPSAAPTPEVAPVAAAATTPRPRRAFLPGFARPSASVPASGEEPVAPSPSAPSPSAPSPVAPSLSVPSPSAPAAADGPPIAVVRSGRASPAAPGSGHRPTGARIIRIDPD
jgi:hypothetical protein